MMYGWDELGIQDRLETISNIDVYNSGFQDNQFDLAWNFVTWTELDDPPRYLEEIKATSGN